MARQVIALLAEDARTSVLIDGGAWDLIPDSEDALSGPDGAIPAPEQGGRETREGERIGAYVLRGLMGRGGMGAVYAADRVDGDFEQRVALKLIRSGHDSEVLHARFRAERQILARLDHPNIARLLDGGITETGEPWFALEFVDGQPITEYCDDLKLPPEARVRLFRTVCSAVQYAHANLVIHRDLKPSNILVARDGTVKLLDFGIAKLLDPDQLDPAGHETRTGVRVLTPRYASPEQLRGDPVTTASDIYALGLLLYRLLTGRDPHDRAESTDRSTFERDIQETMPSPPSTAATPLAAAAQRVSLDRLRHRLRGDLDSIILKSLRKEPVRRYTSVPELSEDLSRFLSGMPVSARPDEWSYRARRFIGRHKASVAAATVAAMAVTGFGITMSIQARRIAQERDIATTQRAKAERVADFLVDVFEANDPNEARGIEMTAGQILSRGGERVRTELSDEPEVQAAVLDAIGRVYRSLAEFDSASVFLETAREIREHNLGTDHPDYTRSLTLLAELARRRGQLDDAIRLNTEALALLTELDGPWSLEVAHSLSNLSVAVSDVGDLAAGDSLIRQSLAIREDLLPPDDPVLATTLNNLGTLLNDRAQYDSAAVVYDRVLEIRLAKLGEDHLETAIALNNLATTHEWAGHFEEADSLYRQSLAIREKLLDERHPDVLIVKNNLGGLMLRSGKAGQAIPLYHEIIAIRRENPQEAFALGIPLNNLGQAYLRLERYDEAVAAFEESYSVLLEQLGDEHPTVSYPLSGRASARSAMGDYDAAEAALLEVIEIRSGAYEGGHPSIAFTMDELGTLYMDQQRYAEAEPLLVQALEMRRELLDVDHPQMANSLQALGLLRLHQERPAEAEPLLREGLEIRLAKLDPESVAVATLRASLGRCLTDLGDHDEAERLLTQALGALQEALGPESATTRRVAGYLRDLYESAGDSAAAARYADLAEATS